MSRLLAALQSESVLLMDGAMGSELYQAGLEPGECGEEWNLSRPQRVRAVHQAHAEAGARCLLTNTFQANPVALARHGLEEKLEAIIAAGVRQARAAAGDGGFVLGDIGPILISPDDKEFSDWDDLARVVEAFAAAEGVDALLLETCSSPRALSAVEFIRRRVLGYDDRPVLLSLAYRQRPDGALATHSGHGPETFARHAERHGVAALGVNCGRDIGIDEAAAVVRRYRRETGLPLFARPNAGTPTRAGGDWVYPRTPEEMARRLPELLKAGAAMVGGCCGTTPAHVVALRPVIAEWNEKAPPRRDERGQTPSRPAR